MTRLKNIAFMERDHEPYTNTFDVQRRDENPDGVRVGFGGSAWWNPTLPSYFLVFFHRI